MVAVFSDQSLLLGTRLMITQLDVMDDVMYDVTSSLIMHHVIHMT